MTAAHNQHLGARLAGGLVLERFVGAGKFAWVYEARAGAERVAVKVLYRDDEQGRRRFQREIKVMRQLPPHANCVGYRAHGELEDGSPWVAMEFIDGFNLQSVVNTRRPVPVRSACLLMAQICDGFRELHALGLTHRDITPDNIMVTHRDRAVKIMDFGLAQDSQGLLRLFEASDILAGHDFADDLDAGLIAGTPEYMAPEQITDPRHGARQTDTTADVFALGVVFYQLLTGRHLFPFAEISGGLDGRPGLVRYLNHRQAFVDDDLVCPDELDAELWSIVRKTLSRDPRMRQRTAAELADDLRFYLETGQGVLEDDLSQTVAQEVDPRALLRSAVMTTAEFDDLRSRTDERVALPASAAPHPPRVKPAAEATTVTSRAPNLAPPPLPTAPASPSPLLASIRSQRPTPQAPPQPSRRANTATLLLLALVGLAAMAMLALFLAR